MGQKGSAEREEQQREEKVEASSSPFWLEGFTLSLGLLSFAFSSLLHLGLRRFRSQLPYKGRVMAMPTSGFAGRACRSVTDPNVSMGNG